MEKTVRKGWRTVCVLGLLFFAVSFFGWVGETVYAFLLTGRFCDRGFLYLPICPIYGCSVLTVYGLLGTPEEGGLLLRRVTHPLGRWSLYAVFSALIPTAAELVTGAFFHRALGIRLWDYSSKPLNLGGYICLPFTLVWGLLIPPAMGLLFPRLLRPAERMPFRRAAVLTGLLAAAVGGELILRWIL